MPDYIRKLNKFLETKCPIKCIPMKVLKQARDAINGYSTCPYCWGVNGHAKGCKFYEALQNIDALIGGKEDA